MSSSNHEVSKTAETANKAEWVEPRITAETLIDETRGAGGAGTDFGSEVSAI